MTKGWKTINNFPVMIPYFFMPMNVPQGQQMPSDQQNANWQASGFMSIPLQDYGSNPFVANMKVTARQNTNYRTALWTGKHFQITLMSLNVGEDIGLEVHPDTDQFLYIEMGQGLVQMGPSKDNLNFVRNAAENSAIAVPAGTWHNVTNIGSVPLKLFVIYAPPHHPFGTVHATKAIAEEEEKGYGQ